MLLESAATSGRPTLPAPYASNSTANGAVVVGKPADAQLNAPLGFQVKLLASGLDQPRLIRVAPNGDIFIAESSAGRIRVLRPSDRGDEVSRNEIFASGLKLPFGIAFYPNGNDPQWVYVANTNSVVRFRYRNGDLHANEEAEVIVPVLPHGGNHWTRDIAFSLDDTKMFISVGSASNDAELMAKIRHRVSASMDSFPASTDKECIVWPHRRPMRSSAPMFSCSTRKAKAGAFTRVAFAIA